MGQRLCIYPIVPEVLFPIQNLIFSYLTSHSKSPYFSSITCYASCRLATRLLTSHLSPFTIILVSLYFTWYLHCSVFYLGSNMVQKRYFSIEFLTSFQVHSTTSNWSGNFRKPIWLGQLFCACKCKQPTTRSPSQPNPCTSLPITSRGIAAFALALFTQFNVIRCIYLR